MKRKRYSVWAGAALLLILAGCDPVPSIQSFPWSDIQAPQLKEWSIDARGIVTMQFDESVRPVNGTLKVLNASRDCVTSFLSQDDPSKVAFTIVGSLAPGSPSSLNLSVEDASGNSLAIEAPFLGPNPDPAVLLINEVLTKVSTKNRDAVELLVTRAGNIGGVTVFIGSKDFHDYSYVFPSVRVQEGDLVVLHTRAQKTAGEVDELSGISASGGLNASAGARDFWMPKDVGLPDDSGMVWLSENPKGKLYDVVFYSNKTTVAGKEYRSFGTKKMLDEAENLAGSKAWPLKGSLIAVEDAVPSKGISSTRTLCRIPGSTAIGPGAWFVCASKGASIGSNNTPP